MAGYIGEKRLNYFSKALTTDGTLNVLLVCTFQPYLEEIGHNLYVTREVQREKRTYSLKVHTCKFITDVLEYMPEEFYVDYIVFLLKPEMGNCLTEVSNNLMWIDSNFPKEKICLVNPNATFLDSTVSPNDIWEFAIEHQFNVINGQIKKQNGFFNLSKKILNLAEACCGVMEGVPMVNIV
ncbi:conserved hypothetical protein [Pediculus humanus corporis]|uniref:Uncharacterized protein n=1 Tax=Pediculus humanus subsp. corporis TaxID=121224 RepID=E0V9X3_PEDHC|nr:uncharacterized protein Phum_PHUM023440 [Pediculus humanus corporis]EEB10179.1 conserved hypothetical protein [Pediculus humanus corporis]